MMTHYEFEYWKSVLKRKKVALDTVGESIVLARLEKKNGAATQYEELRLYINETGTVSTDLHSTFGTKINNGNPRDVIRMFFGHKNSYFN